ncbi:MAG: DUF4982 domain-containing protein [Muribaculaceae bacterium]|nr:DUF4982 domain-containing protein [Muribaculaceae bacterium]
MKRTLLLAAAIAALGASQAAWAISENRILLDDGWQFSQDSGEWQNVSLPHDWSVLHDFNADEPAGNDGGYLPTGKGNYRKTITVAPEDAGKPCHLYFEGVYMNATVRCNGLEAGFHPYGYTSFRCDIGPMLKAGENLIEVDVDNSRQKNCRWYSGSGIYRHVWLEPHAGVYVEPASLCVTTPEVSRERGVARVDYTVRIAEPAPADRRLPVTVAITGPGGFETSRTDSLLVTAGADTAFGTCEIAVAAPELWSVDSPALYRATLTLPQPDGSTPESESERFGFRSIAYNPAEGFLLNGEPILITGACIHHDNGILGAASYDDAELRKVKLLKQAGFNAVRTSHNPVAPAFLDACDSLGLMVIDETFDGWRASKNTHDYSEVFDEWWQRDVASTVKRDRNHPSVICWSTGNEIIERKTADAVKIARDLAAECRRLDPSRPVTSALAAWDSDWEIYDALAAAHDITGYNYMIHKAESDHARVPSRMMWQTESFPRDAFGNWEKVHDLPYVAGDFVWTGIDYIGESGIGRYYYTGDPEGEHWVRPLWPWHNSYCGDIDIIGHRKPISHYREMLYAAEPQLYLAVHEPDGYHGEIRETMWGTHPAAESWNWAGHEGKDINVEVMSTYPSVELYVNGESAGRKPTGRAERFHAVYTVPYTPGNIRAVAYDDAGLPADTMEIATAGKPYAIRLTADRDRLAPGTQSLAFITAEVVDRQGRVVPDAALPLQFKATGGARVIATGSGDPKDPRGYFRSERTTSGGRALGIIKATGDAAPATVTVSAPGLRAGKLTL